MVACRNLFYLCGGFDREIHYHHIFPFLHRGFLRSTAPSTEGARGGGVSFGHDGPSVSHLLFADESVVFLEATTANLETL
jgi:hypothetical protein